MSFVFMRFNAKLLKARAEGIPDLSKRKNTMIMAVI